MTLRQAFEQGIRFVRRSNWAFDDDHLELPPVDENGYHGPWAVLHSPASERIALEMEQNTNPNVDTRAEAFHQMARQDMLMVTLDLDEEGWVPYN
jgi:hypothetical protein